MGNMFMNAYDIKLLNFSPSDAKMVEYIPVGVSNRHIHLSECDRDTLFGCGYRFSYLKSLSQKGQFSAKEEVVLIGKKGIIENVRVLGPERSATQVEILRADMYKLGINVPVRDSGDIDGTPGIIIIGPEGIVDLSSGVICAKRHIHMSPVDAIHFGVRSGDEIWLGVDNERGLIFGNVLVRVHESFLLEFHVDIEEANAAGLRNTDGKCYMINVANMSK